MMPVDGLSHAFLANTHPGDGSEDAGYRAKLLGRHPGKSNKGHDALILCLSCATSASATSTSEQNPQAPATDSAASGMPLQAWRGVEQPDAAGQAGFVSMRWGAKSFELAAMRCKTAVVEQLLSHVRAPESAKVVQDHCPPDRLVLLVSHKALCAAFIKHPSIHNVGPCKVISVSLVGFIFGDLHLCYERLNTKTMHCHRQTERSICPVILIRVRCCLLSITRQI